MSSDASWAMEMWKAKNASHISTALTTAARYTRPQHQTEKLQLWLDEKTGAGHNYIGGIERGERNVALENIVRLAKALSVSPKELFIDF